MKKWLDRLADALKRLAGKAVEALSAIVRSVVGAILSFLSKAVGFVAEHTWSVIVFVAGSIGWWLMQRVQKKQGATRLVMVPGQTFIVVSEECTLLWSVSCLSFAIAAKLTCLA